MRKAATMTYTFSENHKAKMTKRYLGIISIQYGLGAVAILYLLISQWSTLELAAKIPLGAGLLFLPIVRVLFQKQFAKKMSTSYEITGGNLIMAELGTTKHTVPLNTIKEIKKVAGAHKIQSGSGTLHVLDGIENKEELMQTIENGRA